MPVLFLLSILVLTTSSCHTVWGIEGLATDVGVCGDGFVTVGTELCDDGNWISGDGCSADCQSLEICGNGYVDIDEACDDGGATGACDIDCTWAECGDGLVNPAAGEACDDGAMTAECDDDCTLPMCGDGRHNSLAGEACDHLGESATCDYDCSPVLCGDGILNRLAGEQCDAGGSSNSTCSAVTCQHSECGDGTLDMFEVCDDGNTENGDGCSMDCLSETCGDGIRQLDQEDCDPSPERFNDANCDLDCSDVICGDGIVNLSDGEECDDGNGLNFDDCSSCRLPLCGNGTRDPLEQCDDGNTENGDGCSRQCRMERVCGNGILETSIGEECDDGNILNDDGCSWVCRLE